MKLAVHERIGILNLLPPKENYAGIIALRKAKGILSFNEDEQKLYKLVQMDNGQWKWDGDAAAKNIADLPIEQYVVEKVREKLAAMDANSELSEQYISLYEKFIINYRSVE